MTFGQKQYLKETMVLNFRTLKNVFLFPLTKCNTQSHSTTQVARYTIYPLHTHKFVICILYLKTKGEDNVYSRKKNSFVTRAKV